MKRFTVRASWDPDAQVWWGTNDELPLTTEAPSFDGLVARVMEIAPEMAVQNGHAETGEEVEIHVTGERIQSARARAA